MRIYSPKNNQIEFPNSIKYLEGEFKNIEGSSTSRHIMMELDDDSSRKLATIVKRLARPEGNLFFELIIINEDDQLYFEKGQPGAVVTNNGMQFRARNVNRAHYDCVMQGNLDNGAKYQIEIGNIVFYLDGIEPLQLEDNGKKELNYERVRGELFPGHYSIESL